MGQHTIALNEQAFAALNEFQQRMASQGNHYSISRLVTFLLMFAKKIHDEANQVASMPDPLQREKAYMHLIAGAMMLRPDSVRARRRPCYKATPEQRAMVTQQIITRLGIQNPPKQLVDAYLDQGGMDPMIGSKVGRLTPADKDAASEESAARQALEESKAREKTQQEPLKTDPWSAPSHQP